MAVESSHDAPPEYPRAHLERQWIAAYSAGAGHDPRALMRRADDDARRLLAEASQYASEKLSELEARSHYVRRLHGAEA